MGSDSRPSSLRDGSRYEVSIVIPCYNEKGAIAQTVESIEETVSGAPFSTQILVVDDGSTDGTTEVLDGLAGRITLLKNGRNFGYGASLKRGIRAAHGDLICIIDADGTYPPDVIPKLVAAMGDRQCQMVVAARTGANVSVPLIRKPAKWILGHLAAYVAGVPIPDMNSGCRIFPRYLAFRMMDLLPDGFSFTTTITLAMLTNGYDVHYISIDYHARVGKSKIRPIRDTLNFLQLIAKIALYFAPLKVFLPISAILIVLSFVWALFSMFILGKLADVSTLVLAMTGVQLGAVGMLADMIHVRLPNERRRNK